MPSPSSPSVAIVVATLLACVAVAGWTAAPAAGRPYVYCEGGPGSVLQDTVSVANPSGHAAHFTLYGVDAFTASGGSFTTRTAAESTDAGTWLRFAASSLTVPGRTRADVPFTLTVPAGTSPGAHPAAIVVEDDGGGQQTVPIHLRVTGPALSAIGVEDVTAVRTSGASGAAEIRYTLVNRGNTVLAPSLAVRADGVLGPVLRRPARPLGIELQPGHQVTLAESWPHPPALDAVSLRLTATAGRRAQASATASYEAVPWAAIGIAIMIGAPAAAGGGALVAVRRRKRPPADDHRQDDSTRRLVGAAT